MNSRVPYVERQKLTLVRVVERTFGKTLRVLFWYGGGKAFTGRGAHMKALSAARRVAEYATAR